MSSNYVVGLDIGSSAIKAAVAEVKKNKTLSLVQTFKMPSAGLRRGVVDDLQEATRAVSQVLSEIKKISNNAIKNIFLSVGSPDFKTQASKGMAAVVRADSEINQDDIDRATENAQAIKLPGNRTVIHYVTQQYVIDDMGDVKDPLGMVGNRLEVLNLIIHAFGPNVKNLTKCVESAGGSVAGLIFAPLAASRAILSKNQKELGTVLIDIGFGKTGMSVYEENKLLHTAVFPIGSGHVTNDLAIRLKISVPSAENIKLTLGSAVAKEISNRENIDLNKFDSAARGAFSRRLIAETIEMRFAEIMELVNSELKMIGKAAHLPAGAVLVGGGSKLPATVDLTKQELKLSAQVGVPNLSEIDVSKASDSISQLEDPEWACAFGLLLHGADRLSGVKTGRVNTVLAFFKKLFNIFTP